MLPKRQSIFSGSTLKENFNSMDGLRLAVKDFYRAKKLNYKYVRTWPNGVKFDPEKIYFLFNLTATTIEPVTAAREIHTGTGE